MPGNAKGVLSLHELQQEFAELEKSRAVLLRERKIFRRLGFSPERVNLRLRQLDARSNEVLEAIRRCQQDQRERAAGFAGVGHSYGSSPLA